MNAHTPPEHRAFVEAVRAQESLLFFTRLMFAREKKARWQQAAHHRVICEALQRVERGKCKRLIICIPPRYGKTQLAVHSFIPWCLGRHPDAEFITISYSGRLAGLNSFAARALVASPAYQAIFPGVHLSADMAARDHWRTTAGGVVYSSGVNGTLTGFGAGKKREEFGGCIIVDDALKAEEARAESGLVREGTNEWFMNTLYSRRNDKNTPIVVIGQRLHENDLPGFLMAGGSGEDWEVLELPAIQSDGSPLWPEMHDIEALRRMETAAPWTFAGQYMQSPVPDGGGIFKPDNIRVLDAKPECRRWVRAWDFAASDNDGDYTVGLLLGEIDSHHWFVGDVVRLRGRPDDVLNAVRQTATLDTPKVRISIPQDPGAAGKFMAEHMVSLLKGFPAVASPEVKDKITRAEPCAAQVNIGSFSMLRAEWNMPFVNELRVFPAGSHDDMVDALSRAFQFFVEMKGHVPVSESLLLKSRIKRRFAL